MILGSPLGAAPKFGFTVQITIPETNEVLHLEVRLGESIEIREDDRVAAIIKITGLYSKDESSNSGKQGGNSDIGLPASPEISGDSPSDVK